MAQLVKRPTLARVMISQFVSSSCLLSAWSPLQILCPLLSMSLPTLLKINKLNRKKMFKGLSINKLIIYMYMCGFSGVNIQGSW